MLSVWCADWPVVAAARPPGSPVAVVAAHRVVAAGPVARAEGVVPGLRRREAQARCPSVDLVEHDPARDARVFETVLGALEPVAPRLEVGRPGTCAVPTRGPSRRLGGDRALAALVLDRVRAALVEGPGAGHLPCAVGVGVADGPRAAAVAAEEAVVRHQGARPLVVPPGATAEFLAPLPVGSLFPDPADALAESLARLGLRTVGRFAALDPSDVLARFGRAGHEVHLVARGQEDRRPCLVDPPPDLTVTVDLDPPLERVDQAAFVVRPLAEDLLAGLSARALVADRVLVVVTTTSGEVQERSWRHEGDLTPSAVAQRVRWQIDGWLTTGRLPGGVVRLELRPEAVRPADGVQLGLWGDHGAVRDRAVRGMARVQALLGPESVRVPEWQGGRAPGEHYRLVPIDLADPAARAVDDDRPWPGRVPPPHPSEVWTPPRPAEVLDAQGHRVGVGGRGRATAAPSRCRLVDGPWQEVVAWAGPWCTDERWWDPVRHRRRARLQVLLGADRTAHLLVLEDGRWWWEAAYG